MDDRAAMDDGDVNDPNVWSGRASQEVSSIWLAVLHQCIRPLIGAVVAPGHSWISARVRSSLADRPRTGHLGHQCSHAPGRPILHLVVILSQTSAGKGVGYVIDRLRAWLCSFVRA